MSLYNSYDRTKFFSELGDVIDVGSGAIAPATQRVTALRNLLGDTSITLAQVTALSGVTPGTVTASKALVVDSNKDLSSLRNVSVTNLDAGASGTAGTVDVFPSTASKGKLAITAAANAGDTTNTLVNASQTTTATWTIPDTNGNASFVMTAAAQTIGGAKTFSANPVLGTGVTIDLDSFTATLSSNATSQTKFAGVITTESLTTVAGASQALTITLTGLVAAGDIAIVTKAGGGNTRKNYQLEAVTSSNTVTVTVYNTEPVNALNGTLIFNLWVLKA